MAFGSTDRYDDDPNGEDGGGGLLLGLGITEIIVFLFIVICIYLALRNSKALRTSLIGAIGGYKDKEKGILDENSRMYRFAKAIGIIPPPPPKSTTQNRGPVEDQKAEQDVNKVYAAHREANELARKLEEITGKKPNCSYAIDTDTGAALLGRLGAVADSISRLLQTAEQGRILREGVRTVIFARC